MLLILVASLVGTALFAQWAWSWSRDFDKDIAAITMVFTAAALGITVLAGMIALAAY